MSEYTAKRINDLENNVVDVEDKVSGDGSIVKTIINGWTKKSYPNGQIEATVTLDYDLDHSNMEIATVSWQISETIPTGIFNDYPSVEAQCIDISPGHTNKNSIVIARNTLPSQTDTGKFNFQPLQYVWSTNGYDIPTKIQIVWIAKGN